LLCSSAGIGRKGVYLYNLPEVMSAFKYIKVPGVSARFGTDPFIWNWAMWLVARLCPSQFLQDRSQVRCLVVMHDWWLYSYQINILWLQPSYGFHRSRTVVTDVSGVS
jgi:hypothetical protein